MSAALSEVVKLTENIWINGVKVRVAVLDAKGQDVLSISAATGRDFTLHRPRWVPDEEVTVCRICDNKFTQVRRRHHCRVCGHVVCSKCCFDKVPIPQYDYVEPERVCEACKPVTSFVSKSLSQLTEFQQESADGLLKYVNSSVDLPKVIEVGGVQALVHLTRSRSTQVQSSVVSAFHTLSLHDPVIPLMLLSGTTQAICNCLLNMPAHLETATSDGLLALTTLCKTCVALRQALFGYGIVDIVSKHFSMKPYIMLLSARLLSLLIDDVSTHQYVTSNSNDILAKLWCMSVEDDEQIQETSLRILSVMSDGDNEEYKQNILQSNPDFHGVLSSILRSRVKTPQLITNAVCLAANLANSKPCLSSMSSVAPGSELVQTLCELPVTYPHNVPLLRHIYRCLANLAASRENAQQLVVHTNTMVRTCFHGNHDRHLSAQALRLVTNLLEHHHQNVLDMLLTDNELLRELVRQFMKTDGVCAAIRGCLMARAENTK